MLNPSDRTAPANPAGRRIVMLNPFDRAAPANAAGGHIVMLNPFDQDHSKVAVAGHQPPILPGYRPLFGAVGHGRALGEPSTGTFGWPCPSDRAAPANPAGRRIVMLNPSDRAAPANAAGGHIVMLNPSNRAAPANAAGGHIPEPPS